MAVFNHIFKQDYDKRIKVGDEYIFCYSKKKLLELYPEKNYSISGVALRGTQKSREAFDVRQAKKLARLKEKGLAEADVTTLKTGNLNIGRNVIGVYPEEVIAPFFNKIDGYVCVSDGTLVALHSSRLPFLALLSLLALAFISTTTVTTLLLLHPLSPHYVFRDNPLPKVDPNVAPIENDDSQKVQSSNGGGSIRVQFYGEVAVSISKESATMSYRNPNASNQDVVIELFVVDGDKEYFLGRSGRVPAGSALSKISIEDREVDLTEGKYKGKVYFHSYDSVTGQKAVVVANIGNLDLIVSN